MWYREKHDWEINSIQGIQGPSHFLLDQDTLPQITPGELSNKCAINWVNLMQHVKNMSRSKSYERNNFHDNLAHFTINTCSIVCCNCDILHKLFYLWGKM